MCRLSSAVTSIRRPLTSVVCGRREVDRLAYTETIKETSLGQALSSLCSANVLFAEYDAVLRGTARRFAPAYEVRCRFRPRAPWFDAERRAIRRECLQMDSRYRKTRIVVFVRPFRSPQARRVRLQSTTSAGTYSADTAKAVPLFKVVRLPL